MNQESEANPENPETATEQTPPEKERVVTEQERIEELEQALAQAKKDYLLTLADAENTRKRVQKEKHESIKFAQEGLIADFLTPLDNFENALGFAQNTSKEMQSWAQGFAMILEQFKDILSRHNIRPFSSEGGEFNPNLHEVIEIESTDEIPANTIIKEFTKGYKCGDRILRAARVKVAKAPKEEVLEELDQEIKENKEENKKEA